MSLLQEKYTPEFITKHGLVLAKVIIGSHAFNLHTEKSDKDYYGVYFMDEEDYFSLRYRMDASYKDVVEKSKPEDPDITYMEVGKFFELLANNNPNALELLVSIIENERSSILASLDMNRILSKRCEKTFGEYANTQIKKARGLNKKIVNPIAPERKSPLDFCYIFIDGQTHGLRYWLEKNIYDQKFCGVVNLNNARDSYGLYYDKVSDMLFSGRYSEESVEDWKEMRREANLPMGYGFKGIELENSNDIRLSSIPKIGDKYSSEIAFLGYISYNKDGYIKHCKDYEDYWKWTRNRSEERYNNNLKQNFDTKNISHCIRLLSVAKEIAEGKGLILKRTDDREFILNVKLGNIEYDEAMEYAENIVKDLPKLYKNSTLREEPDFDYLDSKLIELRKRLYYPIPS